MNQADTAVQSITSLECLQKSLEETQATIRGYDTKAEVLGIFLTIIVGVINFGMISSVCDKHGWLKFGAAISMMLGAVTLFTAGMVLFPRKGLAEEIEIGHYKPKSTYYVRLSDKSPYKSLDEYIQQVSETDWLHEIGYEVLKTSLIRDSKHYWLDFAMKWAAVTMASILGLLIGVIYYG